MAQHVCNTLVTVTRVSLSSGWSSKYIRLKVLDIPQTEEPDVEICNTYLSNRLIDNLAAIFQDVFRASSSIIAIFIALSFSIQHDSFYFIANDLWKTRY